MTFSETKETTYDVTGELLEVRRDPWPIASAVLGLVNTIMLIALLVAR